MVFESILLIINFKIVISNDFAITTRFELTLNENL